MLGDVRASWEPLQVQRSDDFAHNQLIKQCDKWTLFTLYQNCAILTHCSLMRWKQELAIAPIFYAGDFPRNIKYLVRILCQSWKDNRVMYKSCSFAFGVDIVAILMSDSMDDDLVDGLSRELRWKEDTYLTYCWHWGLTQIEDRMSNVFSHQMIY